MVPNWVMTWTLGGDAQHSATYEDEAMGATLVIITPRNIATGRHGKPRYRYGLKGVPKVFLSEDELIDAWEELNRGKGGIRIEDCCPNCGHDLES